MLPFGPSFRLTSSLILTSAIALLAALFGGWSTNASTAAPDFTASIVAADTSAKANFGDNLPTQSPDSLSGGESKAAVCWTHDLDLYVTLDGRTPATDDYDRRSTAAPWNNKDEWINIDDADSGNIGILVFYQGTLSSDPAFYELMAETYNDDEVKIGNLSKEDSITYERTGDIYTLEYDPPEGSGSGEVVLSGPPNTGPEVPGKPENVTVTQQEDGVLVEWTAPDNGGVDEYEIYRHRDSIVAANGAFKIATVDGDVTEKEVPPPPVEDANYYYTVRAVGEECTGPFSNIKTTEKFITNISPEEVPNVESFNRKFKLYHDYEEDFSESETTVMVGEQQVGVTGVGGNIIEAEVPADFPTNEYEVTVTIERENMPDATAVAPDKLRVTEPPVIGGGGSPSLSGSTPIPSGEPDSPTVSKASAFQSKAEDATAADVDDDGDQDVIAVHPASGEISWYQNQNGKGQFASANVISANMGGTDQIETADLSGNGQVDILAAASNSLVWFKNDGGNYSSAISISEDVGNVSSVLARDLNQDGFVDVVAADVTGETIEWYRNEGEGYITHQGVIDEATGRVSSLVAMDIDLDGERDILSASSEKNTVVWYENTDDGFSERTVITSSASGAADLALADINGDLNRDLIVASEGDNTLAWYEGTSSGFSGSPHVVSTDVAGVRAVVPIDGEGDGDPDLAAAAGGDDSVVLFENTSGEPVFSSDVITVTDNAADVRDLAVAGLDADIIPDLLSVQDQDPALTFFRGQRLVGADTSAVSSDETVNFEEIGVKIAFSGTSGSGDVVAKKFARQPNGKVGISQSIVSDYRFTVNTDGDLTVGSNTEVRFDVSELGGVNTPSNVTVYKRPTAGSGEFTATETIYDSGENELVLTTDSFSEFVLASDSEPLPVELAEFSGTTISEDQIRLEWETASEQSNAGFAVERRRGEKNENVDPWEEVGFIETKAPGGTSSSPIRYRFTDSDLPFGADALTYRLRQVDTDGSTSYSEKVTLHRGVEQTKLLGIYPNPVRNRATVRLAVPGKKQVQISLFDVLGRKIRTVADSPQEGRRTVRIDVSDLPSGMYFLRMKAGEKRLSRKFTVVQ